MSCSPGLTTTELILGIGTTIAVVLFFIGLFLAELRYQRNRSRRGY